MLKETSDGVIIPIKVIPKASRSEFVGWENDELKVRIAAIPDKGEANEELIRFIAKSFHLAKSQVSLISGQTSRHKRICLAGISIESIQTTLCTYLKI